MKSNVSQRGSLFGARTNMMSDVASQRRSPFGLQIPSESMYDEEAGRPGNTILTDQNEEMLKNLESKVSELRKVGEEMEHEVSEHNRLLDLMVCCRLLLHPACYYELSCTTVIDGINFFAQGTDFDRATSVMSGVVSKLDQLLQAGGSNSFTLYVTVFTLLVFLLVWWLFR